MRLLIPCTIVLMTISPLACATCVQVTPTADRTRQANTPWNLRHTTLEFLPRGGSVASSSKFFRKMSETDQMPSLFSSSESEYDRYAACLAATEGLRRIRDRSMASSDKESQKQIAAQYVQNSGKVLRSLGMSIGEFNLLGREISQNEQLKERVMEQAYLYRMAATINMDRTNLIDDPSNGQASGERLQSFRRDKVKMFCESMTEIENLRSTQIDRLKRAMQVERFPDEVNISDPTLLPFLSPKVRAVVEAFPLQAEDIVKRNGLKSNEFNDMLDATNSNPIFRWKIHKAIRRGDNPPDEK